MVAPGNTSEAVSGRLSAARVLMSSGDRLGDGLAVGECDAGCLLACASGAPPVPFTSRYDPTSRPPSTMVTPAPASTFSQTRERGFGGLGGKYSGVGPGLGSGDGVAGVTGVTGGGGCRR